MYKTTLTIDGMMCGMCENHINDAIRRALSPKKVTSSHRKGVATIISKDKLDEATIKKVIDETGYELVSISSEPYEKRGLFG